MKNAAQLVRDTMAGWRLAAVVADEAEGILCTVHRSGNGADERQVWIDAKGAVNAHIDGGGYIRTEDGRVF